MSAAPGLVSLEALARERFGEPNRALSTRREWRFGSKGSLSLVIEGRKRGFWYDHESGQGGRLAERETALRPQPSANLPKDRTAAQRIERARRLWAEAEPVQATLGERYLIETRGISRPDGGWPDAVRYHRAERSVILLATLADGTPKGAHVIRLTPQAQNVRGLNGKKIKLTYRLTADPLAGAAVRLEGRENSPASPLLLAEGLETGLSLWAATGRETRIALGSLARSANLPTCRPVVVCRDDDPPDAPATVALAAALECWRDQGIEVAVATPWDVPRGDKSDFNDVIREGGAAAVLTRVTAADREFSTPPSRPTCTMADLRAALLPGNQAWVAGEGPPSLLNNAGTGAGKNETPLRILAHMAKAARQEAFGRRLRICIMGDNHAVVAQHVARARELGMIAAHDAGLDRPYNPADASSPPRCTQKERMEQTRKAGEPTALVACGLDLLGPHCPDHEGCRGRQSLAECGHAEFVGMVADRATSHYLRRELTGFDYVLIDEPPDRVFRPESALLLDLLADHLFEAHPVRDDAKQPDEATTAATRASYAILRQILEATSNGYWPREALQAAGCDAAFFSGLVDVTDRRDNPTGMTAATAPAERAAMARASFRNPIRKLCGFFRLAAKIQAGEEGAGRLELAGDAPRTIVMRPRATLHPSFLKARILVTGAGLELERIRQWLPGVELMAGADMIPAAPHQTVVHIHKAFGKGAASNPDRRRWARSLINLEGDDSRHDATGVTIHKTFEHEFATLPGVLTTHHGGLIGRNVWKNCSTFFGFGARFLSPPAAAAAAAADTGEEVPIKRPVRRMRRIAMKDGGSVSIPVLEYEHPAAQAALRGVRDFDVMQGVFGRPRAADRTALNPVTSFDIGFHQAPAECDYVISSVDQYAPDRLVMMLAEGLAVASSIGRNRLHPLIYKQPWTGQNDKRHEAGGFLATAMRVLSPLWRKSGPREPWIVGRYWRTGHARREDGELFLSTERQLAIHMKILRASEGADRIELERRISPAELAIEPCEIEDQAIMASSSAPACSAWCGSSAACKNTAQGLEHPPDG